MKRSMGATRKKQVLHSMFVFSLAKTTSHSNITNTHTQHRKNKKNKFMGFSLGIAYSFFSMSSFLLKNEHWNEVEAQNFAEVDLASLNSLFRSSVLFEERCADSLWIQVSFHNQQLFQIFHQQ